ncbi:MAG: hypothetical protein FJY92_02425 [Candidatus Hydrogenedentes bacterium]|nr:hypothetical protein [Candidatus Hydrogenedentota bacterium]
MAATISCLAVLLTLSSCATVRLTQDESDALKALRRYVQLDSSGARLDGDRYHSIAALSNWSDEPGWDAFVVTSGAAIGRPVAQPDGTVRVRVRYDAEGVMEGDVFSAVDALAPDVAERLAIGQPIEFALVRTPEGWKVHSPQIAPHVGFSAARAVAKDMGAESALRGLDDAEYLAKLKGARAGHCNCERLDF